jgi:hypothetical protein
MLRVASCKTDSRGLCDPALTEESRNSRVAGGKASEMSLVPPVFLFIPGEWCVAHPQLKRKMI